MSTDRTVANHQPTTGEGRGGKKGKSLPGSVAVELVEQVARLLVEEQAAGSFWHEGEELVGADLSGGCCLAAAITASFLERRSVPAMIACGYPTPLFPARHHHWWVETACGWTLDPTWGQWQNRINPLVTRDKRHVQITNQVALGEFMERRGTYWIPASRILPFYHKDLIARILKRITLPNDHF